MIPSRLKPHRNASSGLFSFSACLDSFYISDYCKKPCGGLAYRQLHLQVRRILDLPAMASLRNVPLRHWQRYIRLSNLGIDRTTKRSHFGSCLLLSDSFVKRFSNFTRSSVGAVDPWTNHRILRNVRNLEQQKAIENNAKS